MGHEGSLPQMAFVHVPKTGGTSVTEALARLYGALTFPAMTTLDYALYSDANLLDYRFYKGHAYRRDYQRLPEGTLRFTVLRDPVARAASYHNYFRRLNESEITDPFMREAVSVARRGSATDLVYSDSPFVIEHLRLGQTRQFLPEPLLQQIGHRQFLTRTMRQDAAAAFIREVDSFDYVLTSEWLDLSFPLMIEEMRLPKSTGKLTQLNVSQPAASYDRTDLRRALVDVNNTEFDCYAYVQKRERTWLGARLAPII